MIDTIKGYIRITNKEYSDFEHLLINQSRTNKPDGFSISFNLSNFKITIKFGFDNKPHTLFFNGSLPKYYFGDNLAQLDLDSTNKAIKRLSADLNLNMKDATITRIDYGISMVLKKPIHKYISCLLPNKRLGILIFKDSITYITKTSNSLIFYDKIDEMKKKQKNAFNELDYEFQRKHILRYEIRLKKLLNNKLKTDSVKAEHLYTEAIQRKLFLIWLQHYNKVEKLSIITDPVYLLKEKNGLLRYLSFHGLEKIGYNKITSEISSIDFKVKNQSAKHSKMMYPIKKLLKEVNSNKLEQNPITELDSKIELMNDLII